MTGFIIDQEHDIPRLSSVCSLCANLTDVHERKCKAFSGGIPLEIWKGENDHTKPFDGDGGVLFESNISNA